MAQDDSRFLGYDMRAMLGSDLSASWPKPGQVVALNVTSVAKPKRSRRHPCATWRSRRPGTSTSA